jgi:hypothetical protein
MRSDTPLGDKDRERLMAIREAIAGGIYRVNPYDVATKLVLSMLEFDDDLSMLNSNNDPLVFGRN